MRLAKEHAIQNLMVECDSKVVVDKILKGATSSPVLKFLLEEILAFLRRRDWNVSICHIDRTANSCADFLANNGHVGSFLLNFVERPCPILHMLLSNDLRGVTPPMVP